MKGDHHTTACLLLTGWLTVFIGCAGTSPPPSTSPSPLIRKARRAYLQGASSSPDQIDRKKLRKAQKFAKKYLEKKPDGPDAAEAWYRIAQVHHLTGNKNSALKAVKRGLDKTDQVTIRTALVKLKGHIYWSLRRVERALVQFRKTTSLLDENPRASAWVNEPDARYWFANALVRNGQFDRGRTVYKSIRESFPDSNAARQARIQLAYLQDHFSLQTGAFQQIDNARKMKNELSREGYNPYIVSVDLPDRRLYCVRIGRFETYKNARREAMEFKQHHHDVIIKP